MAPTAERVLVRLRITCRQLVDELLDRIWRTQAHRGGFVMPVLQAVDGALGQTVVLGVIEHDAERVHHVVPAVLRTFRDQRPLLASHVAAEVGRALERGCHGRYDRLPYPLLVIAHYRQ
jgi:hypothetical protein